MPPLSLALSHLAARTLELDETIESGLFACEIGPIFIPFVVLLSIFVTVHRSSCVFRRNFNINSRNKKQACLLGKPVGFTLEIHPKLGAPFFEAKFFVENMNLGF